MDWTETILEYTQSLKPVEQNGAILRKIASLLDVTRLNESDSESDIAAFFEKVKPLVKQVAALCVYPQFVRFAATAFAGEAIRIATVVNFPTGRQDLLVVLTEIGRAIQDGANEIDVVFPYHRYQTGDKAFAKNFVNSCKALCGDQVILKVILETATYSIPAMLFDAAYDAFTSGADFVKTSTGKIASGATLEAAATLLLVIRDLHPKLNRPLGLKVSGGIKEVEQACLYLELADRIMGREWVTPSTFRIGSSSLGDKILLLGN